MSRAGSATRTIAGRSVLITGGGSGLGAATARWLVERGARVTICGRRLEKVAAVASELGASCRAVAGDVTDAEDRERIVAAALRHGDGLDALVNNAGNMVRGPITELRAEDLRGIFESNVIAAMLLTGQCVPHLAARGGAVVFIGSVHTVRSFPGASPYAATKGAVETLTRVLAAELGSKQIRVNCVRPGAVFTELNQRAGLGDDVSMKNRLEALAPAHALGRIGEGQDVAEAIEYALVAGWTTGAVITVDGGLSLGVTAA